MNHETIKLHQDPAPVELWGLWGPGHGGYWIPSQESAGEPVMCYMTEAEAEEGAQWHHDNEIECEVRRMDRRATGPTEESLARIVELLAESIALNEQILHLPILEHQRGRLNQQHTNLCGIVAELGQRANGVAFKGQPDPRPARPPLPPAPERPVVADAVADLDGWDGTSSGAGGEGGAN